jgi:hypothetical protein
MDLDKKLRALKDRWKNARPEYSKFVSDGILSYSHYKNQNPKILFLLKESNADFIYIAPLKLTSKGYGPKGNSSLFWRYLRGYEYIINSIYNKLDYNHEIVLEKKELPNINTSYVNIKKQCDNKPTSNNKEIAKFALNDKNFLIEQIDLINPDVIYCAGTFGSYKILDDTLAPISEKIYKSNNRIVIDFLHPAHRKGYKTFKDLYDLLSSSKIAQS